MFEIFLIFFSLMKSHRKKCQTISKKNPEMNVSEGEEERRGEGY